MKPDFVALTNAFEACESHPEKFGHLEHIGVAYEMLSRYEFFEAARKYSESINTLATSAGAARKYNATIRLAFLSLIAERMEASNERSFGEFID